MSVPTDTLGGMLTIDDTFAAPALGLDVADRRLLSTAAHTARRSPDRRIPDAVRCYDDPSGMRLTWISGHEETCARASVPARAGDPRQGLAASLVRIEGSVVQADLTGSDGEVIARVLADCDDVWTVPDAHWLGTRLDESATARREDVTLTAVALDVEVDVEVDAVTETDGGHVPSILSAPLPQVSEDFLDAAPYAAIVGRVLSAELVTNELTGRRWYRTVVDASLPVPLALPEDTAPQVGSWVTGYVRLAVSTGIWDPKGTVTSAVELPAGWHGEITDAAGEEVSARAAGRADTVTELRVEGAYATAKVFGERDRQVIVDFDSPAEASWCSCNAPEVLCAHVVATALLLGERAAEGEDSPVGA